MARRTSPIRPLFVAILTGAGALLSAHLLEPVSFAGVRLVEAGLAASPPPVVDDALPVRPLHKVPLPHSRVTPEISKTARALLDHPMGSETILEVEGSPYAFAVERHYHSPESGMTPTGWHKGVTVYALEQ